LLELAVEESPSEIPNVCGAIERVTAMDVFAAAMPIDVAEPALAGELIRPRPQRQVDVR
jgi:hypothetical protein